MSENGVQDSTDSQSLKKVSVSTYDIGSYADPWKAIEDYERVKRAVSKFPEKGSTAISSHVTPRGRISVWVDEGRYARLLSRTP